jgi:hypothetical protein
MPAGIGHSLKEPLYELWNYENLNPDYLKLDPNKVLMK